MRGAGGRSGRRVDWLSRIPGLLFAAWVLSCGQGRPRAAGPVPAPAFAIPRLGPSAITIVPGVYLLGGLSPSAAYAVETPSGIVLIDAGLRADAGPLKVQMSLLGLDWTRIRAILLTHAHGDHTGGAQALRSATGARVHAGAGDAGVLRAGGPREAFFSTFSMPDEATHPTTVDVALEGDEVIEVGGVRFLALSTPGHTPGSICYLMERPGLRVLFAGDVISGLEGEPDSHSRVRAPLGTYAAYLAPRYRGDAAAYLASLRRLRRLDVPDLVLPGHPRSDPSPQSPRLSAERWHELLDRGIRDMEILAARLKVDGADFLDGEPKALLPGLYYLGDRGGRAVYALSASSKLLVVDAPGGPGLLDFLRERLRRLGAKPVDPTAVLLTSAGEPETAGLRELVAGGNVAIVAPREALGRLRASCPGGAMLIAADEWPARGGFEVQPVPLRGGDSPPIAYRLAWAGKSVLLSGQALRRSAGEISSGPDSPDSRGQVLDAMISIYKLAGLRPDLWLPAVPVDGQNANLYDHDWEDIITASYQAANARLARMR